MGGEGREAVGREWVEGESPPQVARTFPNLMQPLLINLMFLLLVPLPGPCGRWSTRSAAAW